MIGTRRLPSPFCFLFSFVAIISVYILLRDQRLSSSSSSRDERVGQGRGGILGGESRLISISSASSLDEQSRLRLKIELCPKQNPLEALITGDGGDITIPPTDPSLSSFKDRDLCDLDAAEIERIRSKPHGYKSQENRYWIDGEWRIFDEAWQLTDAKTDAFVCLIVSVKGEVPCREDECLIPLHVRPKASDLNVVKQLFEQQEYSFVADFSPKTILDAGGNIGMASVIFATMFPDAKIISLEPSKKNYETLLLNVNGFGNVIPLHAGLWKSMSQLRLVNCTTNGNSWEREWGFQVEEVSNWNETEAEFIMTGLTVEFLLRLFDLQSFDFAKIDIEGSEKELFTRSETNTLKWMESTSLFMVEVHDMMRAGAKAIVDGVFNKSGDNKFHMLKDYGMFQAWTNTRLIPTSS